MTNSVIVAFLIFGGYSDNVLLAKKATMTNSVIVAFLIFGGYSDNVLPNHRPSG
ncbi:hypothetical protein HCZ81_06620 [Limosilactobacillus fermentum]